MACLLALVGAKCQSSEVRSEGPVIVVEDGGDRLVYEPRRVSLGDTAVEHESRGGTLVSAWAATVGSLFVEVAHLGDGPVGGELVMTVTAPHGPTAPPRVALGDLAPAVVPEHVPPSWPVALDLALGLVTDETVLLTADGRPLTRADVEDLHQRLLGKIHG